MTISSLCLVVEPRIKRRIEPVVGRGAAALGHGVGRLHRIVDQNDVGAAPRQHAADRGRDAVAAAGGHELGEWLGGEPCRKQRAVPWRRHHLPAIAGEFVRQVLGIGDVDDGESRIMAEQPSRQGDRGGERLQMPRRHVDDEPLHTAVGHALKFCRQNLGVPGRRKFLAAVQLGEAAHQEGIKIGPDQGLDFGGGERGHGGGDRTSLTTAPSTGCAWSPSPASRGRKGVAEFLPREAATGCTEVDSSSNIGRLSAPFSAKRGRCRRRRRMGYGKQGRGGEPFAATFVQSCRRRSGGPYPIRPSGPPSPASWGRRARAIRDVCMP